FVVHFEPHPSVFFSSGLELGDIALTPRLVHFFGTLVAEPTPEQQAVIGHPTEPTHPVPALQGPRQVIDGPVLATGRVRVPTQHIAWTVHPQLVSHFLHLALAQFRAHRPTSMLTQPLNPVLAVFTTPFHQACPMAARDLTDVGNRILLPIQPNRLIAGTLVSITTVPIRPLQFLVSCLCQFKSSLCHPF